MSDLVTIDILILATSKKKIYFCCSYGMIYVDGSIFSKRI
jgi:hypothetical protein